jgi:hypothetical protein
VVIIGFRLVDFVRVRWGVEYWVIIVMVVGVVDNWGLIQEHHQLNRKTIF